MWCSGSRTGNELCRRPIQKRSGDSSRHAKAPEPKTSVVVVVADRDSMSVAAAQASNSFRVPSSQSLDAPEEGSLGGCDGLSQALPGGSQGLHGVAALDV